MFITPLTSELKVVMGGYAEQTVNLDVVPGEVRRVEVSLSSNVFAEQVTVSAPSLEADSATAADAMSRDDCMTRPFGVQEFAARARRVSPARDAGGPAQRLHRDPREIGDQARSFWTAGMSI